MDWQSDRHDDEFETFLRKFQPRKPPALRSGGGAVVVKVVAAAVVVAACAIPIRSMWRTPAAVPTPSIAFSSPRPNLSSVPSVRASQSRRVRVGGAIKAPRRLVNVNPKYPEDAKAAGVEGVVVLLIVIAENGSVSDAQVVQSVPELDQAAIDAVLQWQYEPTLLNGEPVEVECTVTISFTLR